MQVLFRFILFSIPLFVLGEGRPVDSELNPTSRQDSGQCKIYVITGSDWCPNCKRFEEKVLGDTLFQAHLKSVSMDIEIIDFPQKKKQSKQTVKYNDSMATALHFNGNFPGIIIAYQGNQPLHIAYKNETAVEFIRLLNGQIKQSP